MLPRITGGGGLEAEGRAGGCRCGARAARQRPRSAHAPPPGGAPRAAPRRRPFRARASPAPLDVMWAAGLAPWRSRGPSGCSLGARSLPCALRRAPCPARRRRRATSGSVQRVCLQRAGRAGRARARARRRDGLEAVSAAPSRAPCLPLAASAETAPARTALGAARPEAAAPLPASAPQELLELLDREEPSRGLGRTGQERRRRLSPCWPGRPLSPRLGSIAPLAPPFRFFSRCLSRFIFSNRVAARGAVLNSWKGPGCTEDALQFHSRRQ